MQKRFPILPEYDLQLFGDGAGAAGAAAGGAGEGAAQGAEGALPKAETKNRTGSSRRSKAGAYDNVVFGKQDAAAAQNPSPDAGETAQGKGKVNAGVAGREGPLGGTQSGVSTTSDALEAKRQAFKDLIEGEYKDQYTEMFQQAFNRRFKESKAQEQTIAAQKPVMDLLLQKYNITDGDMTKLLTAIEKDDAYWSEDAEKVGMTVEQFKEMQKWKRDSAELELMRKNTQAQQQAQQQLSKWWQEAEQLKGIYPSFDLRTELADRDFQGLLKNGIPMQQAYELKHMDEIKANAARAAAQAAGQQMTARIQTKAARPKENGMSTQSAAITKSDVHGLSRADRAEIARRVQRGAKITF